MFRVKGKLSGSDIERQVIWRDGHVYPSDMEDAVVGFMNAEKKRTGKKAMLVCLQQVPISLDSELCVYEMLRRVLDNVQVISGEVGGFEDSSDLPQGVVQ